jgi:hypothetical protein
VRDVDLDFDEPPFEAQDGGGVDRGQHRPTLRMRRHAERHSGVTPSVTRASREQIWRLRVASRRWQTPSGVTQGVTRTTKKRHVRVTISKLLSHSHRILPRLAQRKRCIAASGTAAGSCRRASFSFASCTWIHDDVARCPCGPGRSMQ